MKIIDQLLQSVTAPSAKVKRICVGVHWTVVESEVGCGMASTMSQPPHNFDVHVRDAGNLRKKSVLKLAEFVHSEIWLEASIGLATLNSLITVDNSSCNNLNARELILEKGKGRNIAIVGHFPFAKVLEASAAKLWVLEKELQDGDTPTSEANKVLPQCDVVGISSTTLINHTLADILGHCRADAFKILIGPSTPMSPALFDFGIDALAGCRVVDADNLFAAVAQGATLRQIKGLELLILQRSQLQSLY